MSPVQSSPVHFSPVNINTPLRDRQLCTNKATLAQTINLGQSLNIAYMSSLHTSGYISYKAIPYQFLLGQKFHVSGKPHILHGFQQNQASIASYKETKLRLFPTSPQGCDGGMHPLVPYPSPFHTLVVSFLLLYCQLCFALEMHTFKFAVFLYAFIRFINIFTFFIHLFISEGNYTSPFSSFALSYLLAHFSRVGPVFCSM